METGQKTFSIDQAEIAEDTKERKSRKDSCQQKTVFQKTKDILVRKAIKHRL